MNELDRFLWKERLRNALRACLIIVPLLIVGVMVLKMRTELASAPQEEVFGVLVSHTRLQDDEGSHKAYLRVRLEDGSEIDVSVFKRQLPEIGGKIRLIRRQTPSGRLRYAFALHQ